MSVAEKLQSLDYGPAPESRTEAEAWLAQHDRTFGHFIAGAWTDGASNSFETRNPATGEVLATVALGDGAAIDAAVYAARKAHKSWAKLSGHQRAKHLYALARLTQKHARLLAVLETLDNGKPIRESRDIDIPLVARHFYHHAGWAQILDGEFPKHVPLGVVGQIIPWNFPLLMLAWKIAPALAAGNTVVLKPAEYTSLTALRFAELCREAGLPAGVVNVVTGAGETGEALVRHADVDKIAFTGSTEIGRRIRELTAGSGKKLSLELGGKSPFIVFEDADLDSAVEGVVDAIWFNQGQVCCAGSRLLVQEGIADRFHAKLRKRMETLRVGDPMDKCVDMGAIVDDVQKKRIESLVATGVDEGAILHQAVTELPASGCFYPPTLLTGVATASTVACVEIFGPVLVSMTFRTPKEAVDLANNSRYGLAASIWSENINVALDVAPAVKAGMVWINCTNQFDAAVGFGGYRESGFGREGGREGLLDYLKPAYEANMPALKPTSPHPAATASGAPDAIDRSAKMYIGGKQARPDSGHSLPVVNAKGKHLGLVGAGSRKDIRNAVEAARKAEGWSKAAAHTRAQIIYYIAENLSAREREFAKRLRAMTGATAKSCAAEVGAAISRLFTYGAWADKHDGAVHAPPQRSLAIAVNEPVGVIGAVCPQNYPLLGLVSVVGPALAAGCRIVALPCEAHPLAATDFYQVLETSDVPAGVVNIVTGRHEDMLATLSSHDQVDAVWFFGDKEGCQVVERNAAATIKRTWVDHGRARDWVDREQGEGVEFMRHASEVKNIWVPYGE